MTTVIHDTRTSFRPVISYMERKVSNGSGILLGKNLYEENPALYYKEFEEICLQNSRVKKHCLHFSLNLPPNETLDTHNFTQLGFHYLEKMGYENCPYLIYLHNDKKHSHIHLIVSSVDYDGNWVNDSFSHLKSYNISRELEKDYNLTPLDSLSKANKKHYSVKEKALNDYSVLNGLKRALYDNKAKSFLDHFLSKSEINDILKGMNNAACKVMLNDKFETINNFLMNNGYCTKYIKDELLKVLDKALSLNSKDEYFKYLSENGVEVSLFSNQIKTQYTYSFSNYDYSFKENRLPKNFSYKELLSKYGAFAGSYVPVSEQKHILYKSIRVTLQESKDFSQFLKNLERTNISYSTHLEGKKPQIQFSLSLVDNQCQLIGEEINKNFSYSSIFHYYESKNKKLNSETVSDIVALTSNFYPDYVPFTLDSHHTRKSDDNLLNFKKKSKRKIDQNRSLLH